MPTEYSRCQLRDKIVRVEDDRCEGEGIMARILGAFRLDETDDDICADCCFRKGRARAWLIPLSAHESLEETIRRDGR